MCGPARPGSGESSTGAVKSEGYRKRLSRARRSRDVGRRPVLRRVTVPGIPGDRVANRAACSAEAPSRSAEAPSRSVEAPSRSAEAPSRSAEAPSRSAEAPSRSVEAPSRSAEAPVVGAAPEPVGRVGRWNRDPCRTGQRVRGVPQEGADVRRVLAWDGSSVVRCRRGPLRRRQCRRLRRDPSQRRRARAQMKPRRARAPVAGEAELPPRHDYNSNGSKLCAVQLVHGAIEDG